MRAGHRHRRPGPAFGRDEGACRITLEQEDAHAEHAARREIVAEAGRDGAEVLGDNQSIGVVRLDRDDALQMCAGHREVRALTRGRALWDYPQPVEAERMVDPDAAGMGKRRADCLDEGREA